MYNDGALQRCAPRRRLMFSPTFGASRQRLESATTRARSAATDAREREPMERKRPKDAPSTADHRAQLSNLKKVMKTVEKPRNNTFVPKYKRKKKMRMGVASRADLATKVVIALQDQPFPDAATLKAVHRDCASVSLFAWLSALCKAHADALEGKIAKTRDFLDCDDTNCFIRLEDDRHWHMACAETGLFAFDGVIPFVDDLETVALLVRQMCGAVDLANKRENTAHMFMFYENGTVTKNILRLVHNVMCRWHQVSEKLNLTWDCDLVVDLVVTLESLVRVELNPFQPPCIEFTPLTMRNLLVAAMCEQRILSPMLEWMGLYFDSTLELSNNNNQLVGRSISTIVGRHLSLLTTVNSCPHIGDELWTAYKPVVMHAYEHFADSKAFWPTMGSSFKPLQRPATNDLKRLGIAMSAVILRVPKTCKSLLAHSVVINHLLKGVCVQLKQAAIDPLAWAAEFRRAPKAPNVFTHRDVIIYALSSRRIQNMLIGDEYKKVFIESLDMLLENTMNYSAAESVNNAVYYARHNFCGAKPPVTEPVEDTEDGVNTALALAFALQVFGRLSTPTYESLFRSKSSELKSMANIFRLCFRLQRSVDRWVPSTRGDKKCKELILSDEDVNFWSMRFEWLRMRIVARTEPKEEKKPPRKAATIVFPSIMKSELGKILSTKSQYRPFEFDCENLALIASQLEANAHDDLARFDPHFDQPARWHNIPRNVYVNESKKLLVKTDIALPDRCSCIMKANKTCTSDRCENRGMKIECSAKCHGGKRCNNRRMQNGITPKVRVVPMKGKGFGVLADDNLPAGTLIGEYCGEVLDQAEYKKREEAYQHERHFYFMTLTPKLTIDASRMSSVTRFINHSCSPNAEAEKWNAGREPRVAIVATRAIQKGEEITFDYSASARSMQTKPCLCGAKNCRKSLTTSHADDHTGPAPVIAATNWGEKKVAAAKKALLKVARLRAASEKAHHKRALIFVDEKRVQAWKPIADRPFFKIPRKKLSDTAATAPPATVGPMLPQKRKAESVVPGFKSRPSFGWQARQSFGQTCAVAPAPRTGRRVFQPAPSRKAVKVARGGRFGMRKRLTEKERIARYDPNDSEYSECSEAHGGDEDSWEYDLRELQELNPYLRDDGMYGEAVPTIDEDKLTSMWAEVKNPYRVDVASYKRRADDVLKRDRARVEAKRVAHAKKEQAQQDAKQRAEADARDRNAQRYEARNPQKQQEQQQQQAHVQQEQEQEQQQYQQQQQANEYDRYHQHGARHDRHGNSQAYPPHYGRRERGYDRGGRKYGASHSNGYHQRPHVRPPPPHALERPHAPGDRRGNDHRDERPHDQGRYGRAPLPAPGYKNGYAGPLPNYERHAHDRGHYGGGRGGAYEQRYNGGREQRYGRGSRGYMRR